MNERIHKNADLAKWRHIRGGDEMLQIAPDRWRCVTTNQDVFGGILLFYRRIGGAPRLALTREQHDRPGVAYQLFEAGVIVWDPQHTLDSPTGFQDSYLLKLDSDLAKRLLH
jgi:hypothetical protein